MHPGGASRQAVRLGAAVASLAIAAAFSYPELGITVATAIGALIIVLGPVTRDRAARPH
jgi:hypothetical protein